MCKQRPLRRRGGEQRGEEGELKEGREREAVEIPRFASPDTDST